MDGILLVDKPQGITSHDVVDFLRRRFGLKKVGHAGTLDPAATGLLVCLLGRKTKDAGKFLNHDKEYAATMRLGIMTDTGDKDGKVIKKNDVPQLSERQIADTFAGFIGEIEQVPPMMSAIKHEGKSLYKFARKGIEVPRKPRQVKIYSLRITGIEMPDISFVVGCSKGTYIRTLCEDIGKKLGCGAYQLSLMRLRSGDFRLEDAMKFDELKKITREELGKFLIKQE